ncbi:hypothetical protein [Profundibacter sp.]
MLPDGIDELLSVLDIQTAMSLIEKTARWAAPETFSYLPLWYPEHARKSLLYKGNWAEKLMNTNRETKISVHKHEGNTYAGKALNAALGMGSKKPKNWSCCHIWGVDDPGFQSTNNVVQDARFYSCIGNMVLLPTPLKAFTDSVPAVKAMLRICARSLYGWQCDHPDMAVVNTQLDGWDQWGDYPASWPRSRDDRARPLGVAAFSAKAKAAADRRKARIFRDLSSAGQHYPRGVVREVLDYWKISP